MISPPEAEGHWSPEFGLPGANGTVRALAVYKGELIAGGRFSRVDGVEVTNIASWDGTRWAPLGPGLEGRVVALDLIEFGGDLVAAGTNVTDDGWVRFTLRWNGTEWSSMDAGLDHRIRSMVVFDGELFATDGEYVLGWNGHSWQPIGDRLPGTDGIHFYGGKLYAGGEFVNSTADSVRYLCRLEEEIWNPVGRALQTGGSLSSHYIGAFTEWDGRLVCGGRAYHIDGQYSAFTAWGDGIHWENMPGLSTRYWEDPRVVCFASYRGELYVGGDFAEVDGEYYPHLARWDGSQWRPVSVGIHPFPLETVVFDLVVFEDQLVIAGTFPGAGGVSATNLVAWDGKEYRPLGPVQAGFESGAVNALADYHGDIVAGGSFEYAGGREIPYIALWNGQNWEGLGAGLNGPATALVVRDGDLYAGGRFTRAGESDANNVARWDGACWHPLGSGVTDGSVYFRRVHSLAFHGDDLVVGGHFTRAGEDSANNIAIWDGQRWRPLGEGLHGYHYPKVFAVRSWQGQLYAGGVFSRSGDKELRGIARWDGSVWNPVGSGVDGEVRSIVPFRHQLVIGGRFGRAGRIRADHVASWDGYRYQSLGTAGTRYADALAVHQGYLYEGGINNQDDGTGGPSLRRWDGYQWESLSSTNTYWVFALLSTGRHLYAGGNFDRVETDLPSYRIAKWEDANPDVGLASFGIERRNASVHLTWTTYVESGIGFHVYRSTDHAQERRITSVPIPTHGATGGDYEFDDFDLEPDRTLAYSLGYFLTDGRELILGPWLFQIGSDPIDPPPGDPDSTGGGALTFDLTSSNPVLGPIHLTYNLPVAGFAKISLHDARGRVIVNLVDGYQPAGAVDLVWHPFDERRHSLPSGVYWLRLETGNVARSVQLVMIR